MDQDRSSYFGDYPNGYYWSAFPPDGATFEGEKEDFTVIGSILRLMWDEGGGPLWDGGGCLPAEAEWLRRALGLSDTVIQDLMTWMDDMGEAHWAPSGERGPIIPVLDRGAELAVRVQHEVGDAFRVVYRP